MPGQSRKGRERGVALVTGAGGGIGRALCRRLAADGWRIGALDLDEAGARAAAEAARLEGAAAEHARCDVTDTGSVTGAVAALEARLGPTRALVNNAGILGPAGTPLADTDPDALALVLDVNLTGALRAASAVVPSLRRAGDGRIVNVCSGAALIGVPGLGAYAASKAALLSLTKTLALELAADGIRVTAVCPGNVETGLLAELERSLAAGGEPDPRARLVSYHALPRLASPEDVAGAVSFLLSADADFVTGSALLVEGGALAGPR